MHGIDDDDDDDDDDDEFFGKHPHGMVRPNPRQLLK